MTKKESQNGSTMGISYYTINEKVSKTRMSRKRGIYSQDPDGERCEKCGRIPGQHEKGEVQNFHKWKKDTPETKISCTKNLDKEAPEWYSTQYGFQKETGECCLVWGCQINE